MWIYKITNLINNKIYIGQTKNKPSVRWGQHKTAAITNERYLISRAIKKYGAHNFKFEVIEKCKKSISDEREYLNIVKFNCLSPVGYNLIAYSPNFNSITSNKTRIRKSRACQKYSKISKEKYIGVHPNKKSFYFIIQKRGKTFYKSFNSEIKAAIAYDIMALYLFGKNARINFEGKRLKWNNSNLRKFFLWFSKPIVTSSKYYNVRLSKSNKWRVGFEIGGKSISFGTYDSELKAANVADKVSVKYNSKFRNFPKRKYSLAELDEVKPTKIVRYSDYPGVYFVKRNNKFRAEIEINKRKYYLGEYITQEEANQVRKTKLKELGLNA